MMKTLVMLLTGGIFATALIVASLQGRRDVLKALLDKGAAVDIRMNDGRTASTIASEYGHTEVADLLRQAAAGK